MASAADIVSRLKASANTGSLDGMAKFGMTVERRLGVSVPEMRRIAKEVGRDHRTGPRAVGNGDSGS